MGGAGGGFGINKGPLTPQAHRDIKSASTGILTTIDIIISFVKGI
jgi:hypothetical protein